MGVELLPEPFTALQQRQSKYDGGVEEMGDSKPRREFLAITPKEKNGH